MEIDLENLSKQELLALLTKAQKTISKQDKAIVKQEKYTCLKASKLETKNLLLKEQITKLEQEKQELEYRVKQLQRMKFGQSRERFEDPNQTQLPLDVEQAVLEEQEEVIKQEITYSR
ncbi:IS66 family transposase, partial [Myroides marinus]|nr:IS66 family transposase [Myroides marinus]MDM1359829.1 IS66 family transposase [Myroides marinus]